MPEGDSELLKEVEKVYNAWFKVSNISYVPKLLAQPKWFKQDKDLLEGDIVMFQKSESDLGSRWTLDTIDQLVKRKDGLARRAIVRYKNTSLAAKGALATPHRLQNPKWPPGGPKMAEGVYP